MPKSRQQQPQNTNKNTMDPSYIYMTIVDAEDDEIAIRHHRNPKAFQSGFGVERAASDGYYYVTAIPRQCRTVSLGDRVLEINGTPWTKFRSEDVANRLFRQTPVVAVDNDDNDEYDDDDDCSRASSVINKAAPSIAIRPTGKRTLLLDGPSSHDGSVGIGSIDELSVESDYSSAQEEIEANQQQGDDDESEFSDDEGVEYIDDDDDDGEFVDESEDESDEGDEEYEEYERPSKRAETKQPTGVKRSNGVSHTTATERTAPRNSNGHVAIPAPPAESPRMISPRLQSPNGSASFQSPQKGSPRRSSASRDRNIGLYSPGGGGWTKVRVNHKK